MTLINSTRLTEIFMDCLLNNDELNEKGEPIIETIYAKGIAIDVHFNKERINNYKEEIENMVDNLDEVFYKGHSFLRMCIDKNNNQWTSHHVIQEQLLLLALSIDKMRYCMAKEDWWLFPGSVPYVISKFEDEYLAPVFG